MIYSEYGKTGKMVSAVGFGGMRFDMEKSLEENAELVRYAFEKGINYFDTAPGYHEGESEEIYGIAFKEMPRDKFFVTDKLMPTSINKADEAYDTVNRMIDKMGVGYIDFFHVWCLRKMEHYEMAVEPGALYEGLQRCKDEGLIKHIVFSSHQQGDEVKKVIKTGKFDGVLLGVNILNYPYRWSGVKYAHKHGLGVAAMNPLAGGLIPKNEDRLDFLAKKGETPTEAALRFLIASDKINVALNGFTTREHVDFACKVADSAEPLSKKQMKKIEAKISKSSLKICTTCGYCDICPKKIPIPKYMQIYNDKVLFDISKEEFNERLKFHREWGLLAEDLPRAAECIKCGKCEKVCTQHLPIIKRLKKFAKRDL